MAIVHFINNPANAPTLSLNDPRFVLFFVLAIAMLYYAWSWASAACAIASRRSSSTMTASALGFGRNRRFTWDDIIWVRLRRLALRPQLADRPRRPRPSSRPTCDSRMWSLDDSLRPIRGQPTTVLVRDNGLDTTAVGDA